jgi:protein-disulfide isomerase
VPRPTPASQKGTPLLPFYIVLGIVALAGAYFVFSKTRSGGGAGTATEPVPVNLTPEQLQRVSGVSKGNANAPITIFEFADYTCPACRNFSVFLEPMVRERLIDSGKARFVFYDFPLGGPAHQHGFLAARAARCAGDQNKFWEMHDALFTHQGDWSFSNEPAELFAQYAAEAGVERGAFQQCLASDKYAKEVSENREFGRSLGVNSTPTLVANGQILPPTFSFQSYDSFEALVRRVAPNVFADSAAAAAPTAPAPAPADSAAR